MSPGPIITAVRVCTRCVEGMCAKLICAHVVCPSQPLDTPDDFARLTLDSVNTDAAFGYLLDGINLTRQRLGGEVPLIGFVGGPWTLFAYAVEKPGAKTFEKSKAWLYKVLAGLYRGHSGWLTAG